MTPSKVSNDSKKLTEKRRDALYEEITKRALAYKSSSSRRRKLTSATFCGPQWTAWRRLWRGWKYARLCADRRQPLRRADTAAEAVVKGDANSASIAAASILAKVSRDRYMLELDKQYPQYQLARHKGYPTKLHYELIAQYGIQPFYRRSFLKKQVLA